MPWPPPRAVGAGALGLGAIVTIAATHRGRRRDRHHHGLGARDARLLHPAGEAAAGRRRRCAEDRGRPRSASRRAPRAVPAGDPAQRANGSARASRPTAASFAPKGRSCSVIDQELREIGDDLAGLRARIERMRHCRSADCGLRRLSRFLDRPVVNHPPVDVLGLFRRPLVAHVEAVRHDPRARLELLSASASASG